MATLKLESVAKEFKDTHAVRGVNLEIQSGEFFSIVGPSGCGKTTVLRLIAGFESPTTGRIFINDRDITDTRPQDRSIGMVFQNYALFPHMTVFGNVAFGLETQGVPRHEISTRVERMLNAVHLKGKADAPVPNLSGGEQQRVAVARALVVEPAVLLFDEPLSNLDVALRVQTREEIRALQRRTGITTIYVTHDQAEAMSLSDRIAVMNAGKFEQVGTPVEVYESPATLFAAEFLGGANVIAGTIDMARKQFVSGSMTMQLPPDFTPSREGNVRAAIKPESLQIVPSEHKAGVAGTVEDTEYLGFTTNFLIATDGTKLRVTAMSSEFTRSLRIGSRVGFCVDWFRCTLFPE